MASVIPGYQYDIFISYRQKDNKYDGWVSEFVDHLKRELEATFKEEISVYFDINSNGGLLETHDVDESLKDKLNCLIFIPIISQTYCDIKSYAWRNELCAFNKMAKDDILGRNIKLTSGYVASRILPVKIHELDEEDNTLLEKELGSILRGIEFIYKEAGVNRPLKPTDNKRDNLNKTDYRNQVNKIANAIKEIIDSLKGPSHVNSISTKLLLPDNNRVVEKIIKTNIRAKILLTISLVIILASAALLLNNYYSPEKGSQKEFKKNITANYKAYEWYMKAEYRLTPENKNDVDSCIFFLNNAIGHDSLFAIAHAELSRAYAIKNYFIDPRGGYSEKAFVEAEKSLYLNPNLAEGYFARAYCNWNFQNKFPHEKTIRELKKAILLKPDMDEAYHQLGVVYLHVGLMDEAFDAYRKSLQINPDNKFAAVDMASINFYTGKKTELEHMIDLFKVTQESLISTFRVTQWATALITLGQNDDAEKLLSVEIKKDTANLFTNSTLAILLAKKGERSGALKKIEFCEKSNLNTGHFHHAVYNLAVAYALMGDYKESVEKLTWVAENGFPNYSFFRDDPLLKSLQQFPPYNDLLKKLKISWDKYRQIASE